MALPFTRRQLLQVGALAAGGWAFGMWLGRNRPLDTRTIDQPDLVREILHGGTSPGSGPVAGSVQLAVFSDYRCPACRKAFPALEEAVRADGKVHLIYKDWPIFGPPSQHAARVALATDEQGIYPQVHRRLMTDPRTINDAMLRDTVTAAGGDGDRTMTWLTEHRADLDAQLARNARQAAALGLPGTPGYLANATLVVGALTAHDFTRLFEQART